MINLNRMILLIISAFFLFAGDVRAGDVTELPGTGDVPAENLQYTPTTSGDWSVVPSTGQEALDNLAGDVSSLSVSGVTYPLKAPLGCTAPNYSFDEVGTDDTGLCSRLDGYIDFQNDGSSTGFISPTGSWNIGGPTSLPNTTHRVFRDDTNGSGQGLSFEIGNKNANEGKMRFSFLNAAASGSQNITWEFLPRKNDDSGAFQGSMVKFEKVSGENTVNFRMDLYENTVGSYPFVTVEHVAGKPILKFNPASTFIDDFEITQGSVNDGLILSGAPSLTGASISLFGNSGGNQFKTIFTNNNVMTAQIINTGDFEFANEIHLLDPDGDYVGFVAPASASSGTYTLPDSFPASDMVLQSDNSGILSWVPVTAPTPTGNPNTFAIFDSAGDLAESTVWFLNESTGEATIQLVASGASLTPLSIQLSGSLTSNLTVDFQNIQTDVDVDFTFLNAAMSGDVGGNYFGISETNSGAVTGSVTMLNLNNSGAIGGNFRGIGVVNTGMADNSTLFYGTHSGDTSGNTFGLEISLADDAMNKHILNLSASSGDVTNWRGIEMSSGGTADSVIGVNVSLSGVSSPNQKIGISVSDGALNINSPFDTSVINASPGFFNMNNLGGQYHIASGDPTTNSLVIGNNLGVQFIAEDDMEPDAFLGNLGFAMNGFISQVVVSDTKTVDAFTFMMAAGSIPTGVVATDGGTITDLSFYRAIGLLPSGGDINVTNMYAFRVDPLITAGGFGTNNWGVWVGDTGVDNWFAKNVVIGGATGQPSGAFALDVTGDGTISGDLAAATLTPANGVSGSFTTVDLKTITVTNGIITAITP